MKPFVLSLVSLAVLAAVASADRLVLHDGAEIETRGPWRAEGKLVIFTSAEGKLSSLRATEVDLEASMAATERAAEPAEEPTPPATSPPPPPVLVLTDRDVTRARSATPAAGDAGTTDATGDDATGSTTDTAGDDPSAAGGGGGRPPVISPAEDLHVATWQAIENSTIGGIELVGQVINRDDAAAVDVTLRVIITDTGGQSRGFDAFLGEPTIPPGRQTRFRIPLPGVFVLADDPVFELRGHAVRPRVVPAAADDADDADAEDGAGEPGS